MILSKYQAKQLRYKARSNKAAIYYTLDSTNGSVKHREFPCVRLSYDETKDSNGNHVITDIILRNDIFTGTYEELLKCMLIVWKDNGIPIEQEYSNFEDLANTNVGDTNGANNGIAISENNDMTTKKSVEYQGLEDIKAQAPKKILSHTELNILRIKCATMRIASMYGEPMESTINEIVSKYPDAVDALNTLYTLDKINPYTISEDSISKAYAEEYSYLKLN